MITQHYITFPLYLPRIIRLFHNWPVYLFNYLGRRNRPAQYRLRNGFRLIDATGTLAGTIAVVFIRREYGLLNSFRTIVDIGANMGGFAVYAAWSAPQAKIYCYEPEDQNFSYLKQNVALNSLGERVIPFKYAIASHRGQKDLAIGESPIHSFVSSLISTNHNKTVYRYQRAECITFQDICERESLSQIDLLKLNCEGSEYEILESLSRKDYDRIGNVRLEYHNLESLGKRGGYLSKLLETQGYEIQRFSRYRGESGFIWARRCEKERRICGISTCSSSWKCGTES